MYFFKSRRTARYGAQGRLAVKRWLTGRAELLSRLNKIESFCFVFGKRVLSLQPQNGTYLYKLCRIVAK